jgi:hypothetical protein
LTAARQSFVVFAGLPSVAVMQPTLVAEREGWVYEEKHDGWRMVAYKHGLEVPAGQPPLSELSLMIEQLLHTLRYVAKP